MKKRSMLAIASLATGFVVAAITPSHAVDHSALGDLHVDDTLSSVDHTLGSDSLAMDESGADRNG
ncbi:MULTISPECIES: hypothetical protein [unclassified Streptomyces]|uniref:hypothetical protein n=1 Tax=unclassified Streptomyces TaxID=2593676 RepID=UPI0011CDF4E6|nr:MULTISPECIES: hypothetical protein [unclassified Streptomyces]TXS64337.1 hypothetical protein EAO69_31750 [Streptomyces sp. me109]